MIPSIALLSRVVALVLLALSLLHVFWAAGGRWGVAAAVPSLKGKPAMTPGPIVTLVVAALLAFAAQVIAQRGGSGPAWLPGWMARAGAWVIGVVFVLRAVGEFNYVGFFKRVRGSRFAELDTRYYSPLVLVLGACAIAVALS